MTKYRYDIHLGHYVPVKGYLYEGTVTGTPEGELSNNQNSNLQNAQQLQSSVNTTSLTNLETAEIEQMRKDMQTKLQNILKDIDRMVSNINLVTTQIANLQSKGAALEKLNAALKQLLQANLDLCNKKFEQSKIENEETKKILAAQKDLIKESLNAISTKLIPSKYQYLFNNSKAVNESNILNAKVYVDKLIKDDGMERIKGMVDFKKAFKNSDLLYGRDKEGGYFAVCVDQEDFNKLVDTLEEAGFYKEDVLALCLSQIFDRTELVK